MWLSLIEHLKKGRGSGARMVHIIREPILFVLGFALISLVPTQLITMERVVLCIMFFIVVGGVLILYSRTKVVAWLTRGRIWVAASIVVISVLLHFASVYAIVWYLYDPLPGSVSDGVSFLLMNDYYIWAKPFDVLSQQLLIALFVDALIRRGLELKRVQVVLLIFFGVVHFGQIFITNVAVGLGFLFMAIIGSFVFPYLLTNYKYGLQYCFAAHLGAYNVVALIAWSLISLQFVESAGAIR